MTMLVKAVAPLNAEAVMPLATAKMHAKIETSDEDALAASMWATAVRWVETHTGLSLQRRTWVVTYDGFAPSLRLPVGPNPVVTGVSYVDAVAATIALPGDWRVFGGSVEHVVGWPRGRQVAVSFDAGFQDVAAEEPPLVTAALMLFGHLYRNRDAVVGGTVAEVPFGVEMLCQSYRLPVIG